MVWRITPGSNPRRLRNVPTRRSKVVLVADGLPGCVPGGGAIGGIGGIISFQCLADDAVFNSLFPQFALYHSAAAGLAPLAAAAPLLSKLGVVEQALGLLAWRRSARRRMLRSAGRGGSLSPRRCETARSAGVRRHCEPGLLRTGKPFRGMTRLPVGRRFGAVGGNQGVDVQFVILFQFRYGVCGFSLAVGADAVFN